MTAAARTRRRDDRRTQRAAVARLLAHYAAADPATLAAGRAWYPAAGGLAADCARLAPAGIGPVGAAAVIAALSPRTQWGQNVHAAREACRVARSIRDDPVFGGREGIAAAVAAAAGPFALGLSVRRAAAILAGDRPATVLGGPKVVPFWRAICGDATAVTVDVWAAKAAGWDMRLGLTPRRVGILAASYTQAAELCGELPRDLQAQLWLHVRGVKPSDARAMMRA